MSLLKFQEDPELKDSNGRGPVSFSRVDLDGMPFRGRAPMLREEEWEQLAETVPDGHVEVFDMSIPEHRFALKKVTEGAAVQWYTIHLMDHKMVAQPDGTVKVFVFCIWTVPYKEINRNRLPQGVTQPSHSMM